MCTEILIWVKYCVVYNFDKLVLIMMILDLFMFIFYCLFDYKCGRILSEIKVYGDYKKWNRDYLEMVVMRLGFGV